MESKQKKSNLKLNKRISMKIRFVSASVFLLMLGRWLWTDTYFSIFVKDIIWNSWGVTAIGTILAFSKLSLVLPVWKLNDYANVKYILLIWKILYALCGLFFFLAGICHSLVILIIATILNGFANATTFTSYRSYYWKSATKKTNNQVFWVYFSSTYIAEVFGSLIAALLVKYLDLPYMYLFVVIFALVSLLEDQKIKSEISSKYNRTWKKRYKTAKAESKYEAKLLKEWKTEQDFLGKKWFLREFIRECTSLDSFRDVFKTLNWYKWNIYIALLSQLLNNLLNNIWFLFIPIISIENNLSLSQIAIIFAVMKAPYIINVFLWKFGDKHSKKILISSILIVMSLLYIAMWFAQWFYSILILTFWISMWVAMLNPLTSALVTSYTHPKDKWAMSWVQDFACKLWDISGVLWFWLLTSFIGLRWWFMVVWLCTLWLSSYLLAKKLISRRNKRRERENKEIEYSLPIPVVDASTDVSQP